MNIEELLNNTDQLSLYMGSALECAEKSLPLDIPIGAVILHVPTNEIIAQSGNSREAKNDPTHHAEITAIRQASEHIGDWRLNECVVFSTLEPCIMCAATLLQARIGAVVFGAPDPQYGAAGSIYNFFVDPRLSHNAPVIGGIRSDECQTLLKDFFETVR